MPNESRELLDVLKLELQFVEKGGYNASRHGTWRPAFIFEDSPACINYDTNSVRRPCKECLLMQLAPPESLKEKAPCRHIPLNHEGETVDYFYRWGTQAELEKALLRWLRATIHRLESQRSQSQPSARVPA